MLDGCFCCELCSDLINGNADDVTPQLLAEKAGELEKESKAVKTTILDKKALEKLGMGFCWL
jgi:leucyl aminopeptidase